MAGVPAVDEPLRTGASAPDEVAVVIGVEDYVFLPDVPYARRDAQAMYDWLVSTRGVPLDRVKKLDGGSREQIVAAVEEAGKNATAGGKVWLYFAGHGVAAPSDGSRLVLGDDTRQDPTAFEPRGVPVDELERLAAAGGAEVVVMVDACFNGTGRSGAPIVSGTRFAVPTWATVPRDRTLTWAAAGPDQLSRPLDAARHGAFTYFSIGALRGWADGEIDGQRDGDVTAEEAQLFLQRSLHAVGIDDQQPVLSVSDAKGWSLSSATEARPVFDPDAFLAAPTPTFTIPTPSGGRWDPALLETAASLRIELPLRKTMLGYKDSAGERVRGDDYMRLVRATEKGRKSIGLRTVGIVAAPVGWAAAFGFGFAALAGEQPGLAVPAAGGLAVTIGGVGLLIAGQSGIQHAVEPLPPPR